MIIFLHGPDTYRSRQKLAGLIAKFKREVDTSGLNIEHLAGVTISAHDFEVAIKTPPFLAPKRMVVVESILESKNTDVIETAVALLPRLADDSVIVIFWEGAPVTKRKSAKAGKVVKGKSNKATPDLKKLLEKEKFAQEFAVLTPGQTLQFAQTLVKERGGVIEPDALRNLVDVVGNDLWRLSNEIDKLIAYTGEKSITVADIEEMVTSTLERDVFALTDAISEKRSADAVRLIAEQFSIGVKPLELLATLTWQIRTMIMIQDFLTYNGAGYTPERVAAGLGIHPFVAKKIMRTIGRHGAAHLKTAYSSLRDIDRSIKTSQADPQVLLDLLVTAL